MNTASMIHNLRELAQLKVRRMHDAIDDAPTVREQRILYIPSRIEIEQLKLGDDAPGWGFEPAKVLDVGEVGTDERGRLFVDYAVQFTEHCALRRRMTEGEPLSGGGTVELIEAIERRHRGERVTLAIGCVWIVLVLGLIALLWSLV